MDHPAFHMGNTAQEQALPYVPDCYVLPHPSDRSSGSDPNNRTPNIPVIDLSGLRVQDAAQKANVVNQIGKACRQLGFFQVVNHGIKQSVLDEALEAADEFFKLPAGEKAKLMSNDVYNPVRYGSSIKDGMDKVQFWRVFLKHYANPLSNWIHLWPQNPPNYREKIGKYSTEVRELTKEIAGAMTESLGLGPSYLAHKLDAGMQTLVLNCYPPCPNPELTLGLPPHSDYSCLTVVLQTASGLEILDQKDSTWKATPNTRGALLVHVGDHFEVLSNGIYKSVVHRATLNSEKMRISIASLQSLGMDEKMEVAKELIRDGRESKYKGSSFKDFLDLLSKNDIGTENFKSFIDTLKID
ncbi:Flavanone 3-dioxygenase 3 [Linum grandiflorum]